jgi:hypothetical protein
VKLIHDEYNEVWIWIDNLNHDIELSPRFDEQPYALAWRGRISKELDSEMDTLYNGSSVVLPTSKEHAEAMIRVAEFYLNNLQ